MVVDFEELVLPYWLLKHMSLCALGDELVLERESVLDWVGA